MTPWKVNIKLVTLALLAVVFVLGACGGDGDEAAPPAEPAEETEAAPPAAEPEEAPPAVAEPPAEAPAEPTPEPEPAPAAEPAAEAAETWDYVALGDSLTGTSSWPEEYVAHIEEDLSVSVELENRGFPGALDDTILLRIQSDESLRDLIREAEVITVNGGVNTLNASRNRYSADLCEGEDNQDCLRTMVEDFQTNWDAILDEIVSLRGPEETLIRALPMWIWVLDRDRANPDDWQTMVAYALAMDEHAVAAAQERGIGVVDVHSAFHGPDAESPAPPGYINEDGLHLTDEASTAIAELLREVGYE